MTAPFASSRLPVGSSASKSGGSFRTARQKATRCCSPPESCAGKWSIRSATPTSSKSSRARRRVAAPERPTYRAASSTFSSAVSDGSNRNDWNRKPTYRPRAWLLAARPSALTRVSSNHSSPPSPSSRSSRTFSSVLFPEPDGPVTTTSSPPFTARSTPASTRIGIPDGARYDFTRPAARSIRYPGGSPRPARPTRPVRWRTPPPPRRAVEQLLRPRDRTVDGPAEHEREPDTGEATHQRHCERLGEHLAPELQIGGAERT